jgi:predicted kinase
MRKDLIILRGIPSSGKSTLVDVLNIKANCCADDYHTRDGIYNWQIENQFKAHSWCIKKCELFMKINVELISVSNTSTTEKELKPYFQLAEKYEYNVFSLIVEKRHNNKNNHDVPDDKIKEMINRFSVKIG